MEVLSFILKRKDSIALFDYQNIGDIPIFSPKKAGVCPGHTTYKKKSCFTTSDQSSNDLAESEENSIC